MKENRDVRRPMMALAAIFTLSFIFGAGISLAADPKRPTEISEGRVPYVDLSQSIDNILATEKEKIDEFKKQASLIPGLKAGTLTAVNAYKIQVSSHGNLLLLPGTRIEDLEKAYAAHRTSLNNIQASLAELKQKLASVKESLSQAEQQYAMNAKHLDEVKSEGGTDPETQTAMKNLDALVKLLSTKRRLLVKLHDGYAGQIAQLEEIQAELAALSNKFDQEIKQRKKQALFARKISPLIGLGWTPLREELNLLGRQARLLISPAFWWNELIVVWESGGFLLITSLLLYAFTLFLIARLRRFCLRLKEKPFCRDYPWRSLAMYLIKRSLVLWGTTLFFYIYTHARGLYLTVPLIQTAMSVLLILLFTMWPLSLLSFWYREEERRIPAQLTWRVQVLVLMIRYFAIAYVVLDGVLGDASVLLLFGRMLFEISLIFWGISFWKIFQKTTEDSFLNQSRIFLKLRPVIIGLGYMIIGAGPIVELAGYGSLALYWYRSWGLSAVVFLWGGIFFLILREWDQRFYESNGIGRHSSERPAQPLRWFIFQFCWLVWFAISATAFVFAWGETHAVIDGLVRVLRYPVKVGGLNLSLMGLVYAFLILFFIHVFVRIWRHLLYEKFLAKSGLEKGLQNSITSITIYLLWGLGVLAALHAFGLSTTSLAVGFGALGIGLGFGLQNIFNNFISGIILLFERPIQVGDAVEINGKWAEVKKINVRSTVVHTYDNAALIIPNSEFISSQVTNWSFRDASLRIKISVGVAYGSDIELVRQTLLEIAGTAEKVLKYPKPDVLFTDFGDSSLVFVLRVWTDVDNMLKVGTNIRFEIDRLFRERGIEIAFPQRDIHIRSTVTEAKLEEGIDTDLKDQIRPVRSHSG